MAKASKPKTAGKPAATAQKLPAPEKPAKELKVTPAPPAQDPLPEKAVDLRTWVGKFWRGSRHITGHGIVRGVVTLEALQAFVAELPPASLNNLGKFIADTDVHAEQDIAAKRSPRSLP